MRELPTTPPPRPTLPAGVYAIDEDWCRDAVIVWGPILIDMLAALSDRLKNEGWDAAWGDAALAAAFGASMVISRDRQTSRALRKALGIKAPRSRGIEISIGLRVEASAEDERD